ncbi:MAG: c-type cytochrome domain-containing protein, partial [Planctomycetota bacterium]
AASVAALASPLTAKCGSCHIDGKRGGFSLATYRDLMNGTEGVGRVLVPGDGATSHIVELIASGDMPRGGGRVTPQETQKLVAWITQGAKFDGASETTNLRSLKAGGGEPAKEEEKKPAAMQVARPTGNETVSFATDVAPILTSRCAECHGAGNPRAGLSVLDFRRLMRGGDSGAVVKAKDVAGSLLIHRIDGSEPPRMPLRRTALSSKEIAAISTWIREGATFDGEDIDTPLTRVTQLARAERATSEELSAMREEAARRNWRLALPDETAETAATEHFLVMGNLPAARLSAIGEEAERLLVEVHDVYGESGEEPFGKGRITVFALAKRIDYSEFRLMVHRSQAPREERGANAYDLVDAYVAVQLGLTSDPRDAAALAQQIAAVYLADYTRNGLPDWLVDGAARVAAARVAPKAEVVADWDASLEDAVAGLKRPADIFGNKLSPSTTGVLRYGFVEGLMRKPRSLRSVLQQAASGDKELEAAFKREYRYTPEELAPLWVNSQRRRR